MRLHIIAVGRLKNGPEQQIYNRYQERFETLGRKLKIGPISLTELSESKAKSKSSRIEQEAQLISKKLNTQSAIIVLDEKGSTLSSQEFSQKILNSRDNGYEQLSFVIGGADGVSENIKQQSSLVLSLSKMTLTHGFARLILLEQMYRSLTILTNHPYHRE